MAVAKLLKFAVRNRWNAEIQFTAEIECRADYSESWKLGLAVKWAVANSANLRSADLSGADLRSADLRSADLSGADLSGADLSGADLRSADLRSADLRSANLRSADLRGADLRSADLRSANLRSANLRIADLRSADLSGADLSGADLSGADLRIAKNFEYALATTRILPEGSLIGWKKCKDGVIVKLSIPETAKRSHAFGRKCRAEYADVLEVIGAKVGIAQHDGATEYHVGRRVTPDKFDDNWMEECSSGIHFFITRLEAEAY